MFFRIIILLLLFSNCKEEYAKISGENNICNDHLTTAFLNDISYSIDPSTDLNNFYNTDIIANSIFQNLFTKRDYLKCSIVLVGKNSDFIVTIMNQNGRLKLSNESLSELKVLSFESYKSWENFGYKNLKFEMNLNENGTKSYVQSEVIESNGLQTFYINSFLINNYKNASLITFTSRESLDIEKLKEAIILIN